jgi:hypothetical protein
MDPLTAYGERAMPNPQVNCRVPKEHHGLIRLVAAKLRENPGFAQALAGLIADTPKAPEPVSGPEVMEAIRELQGRLEALEGRLGSPEGREDSQTAIKPPGGTRRLLKRAMRRPSG